MAAEGIAGSQPPNLGNRGPVTCSVQPVECSFSGTLYPYEQLEVRIAVVVAPTTSPSEVNEVGVSGGEAPGATLARQVRIAAGQAPFEVENYELAPEEAGGAPATQAGSHPFQLTTTLTLNQTSEAKPVALPKDFGVQLPPGLLGNPTPFAQCTDTQFANDFNGVNECQAQTAVGVADVTINEPGSVHLNTFVVPVFNLTPSPGEPARFGFNVEGNPVILDTSIRTGSDYGVTVSVDDITQTASFLSSKVTFWGVPGDPRHDQERGWSCVADGLWRIENQQLPSCAPLSQQETPPLLSLPTACTGPLQTSVLADSWKQPGAFRSYSPSVQTPGMDGCNQLPFAPQIEVKPDVAQTSTPTGLSVKVRVDQQGVLNPGGLAESTLRDTRVTLPAGVLLNPAGADGLEACAEAQIGFTGVEADSDLFTPGLPEPFCPDASKVGTVKIKTPLLPNALEGAVYLASPAPQGEEGRNPFRALVAMYIVARDPVSGVLVKLPGVVTPDPVTGRLVSTFQNTPELPFEELELHFFGGERAPLATPPRCGTYTTTASFAPWSGNQPASRAATFELNQGPGGSACPGASLPFAPSLEAGSTNINAGAFSVLRTTISREDGNQDIQTVQLHMPPGLSGALAGVALCPEAQANAGTCEPASLIGHTIVSVGLGGSPFSVTGGEVFLTGKYAGAPFGLSIVNPAVAGPFDLGKVVVRAKIEVDPQTAQLTITTGAIPHILDGIPLQIKHVSVTIDRPGFTFNPTNCNPLAITGSIGSVEGAGASVSTPFQVTNCATLAFKPKFAVSTSGRTSKANGASLAVRLTYPSAPQGSQANIGSVKVELPKQLPSRLTTLQKACTAAQFDANPAGCPAASVIGHATAVTPILPVPLEGPAYFVSHGGEAFPSLIVVLQGYGVTVDLVGTTFISKAGITSSTFKTVPDVPVGSFELTLPQGPYSALTANGNLCTSKLTMPTDFTAQNGATLPQNTKIAVTGCAKAKALTRAQKLARALKACRKRPRGKQRAACETKARKQYGARKKTKKAAPSKR